MFAKLFFVFVLCLLASVDARKRNEKIVGGTAAKAGQFPFMVYLTVGDSVCGGAIISNGDYILTAAHCFDDFSGPASLVSGQAGTIDISSSANGETRVATSYTLHPKYDSSDTLYDCALVKVSPAFTLGANIRAIPLATSLPTVAGTSTFIAGWGDTSFEGTSPNNLLYVSLPFVTLATCQPFWDDSLVPQVQFCAGGVSGKDSCQGDSGGPLFVTSNVNSPTDATVIGVVSFGEGCGTTTPGVYTDVPGTVIPFVNSVIGQVSASASAPPAASSVAPASSKAAASSVVAASSQVAASSVVPGSSKPATTQVSGKVFPPNCGDGIVQSDEQCDNGKAPAAFWNKHCCQILTCTFRTGKRCGRVSKPTVKGTCFTRALRCSSAGVCGPAVKFDGRGCKKPSGTQGICLSGVCS